MRPRCCVGLTRAARVAVTARCPCATTASVSAYASTAPSSGLQQARPLRHPACPRPGSRRTPHLESTCALSLPSCAPAIRGCATPLRISATLCRCITEHCCSFALTRIASRCVVIAMHRLGSQGLSVAYSAVLCFPLALSRGATPSRDIAFQSRRPANLGGALPSPCLASLCFAMPWLCSAQQSNAFAARISPSPLHAAALLRRCPAAHCSASP